MMKRFPILFSWITLFVAPTIVIGESTGSLSGVIIGKSTKEPLVGVNVIVAGKI